MNGWSICVAGALDSPAHGFFAKLEEGTIEIDCIWNGESWEESLYFVRNENQDKEIQNNTKQRFAVEIERDGTNYNLTYINGLGSQKYISIFNVNRLLIAVIKPKSASCPINTIDFQDFKVLDALVLSRITKLEINLEAVDCPINLNLNTLPHFKDYRLQLQSFCLKSLGSIDFNMNALLELNQLKSLQVPFFLGERLTHFGQLESLVMPGAMSCFPYQIEALPHLTELRELPSLYSNQFETLHAERYFEVLLELKKEVYSTHETRLETLLDAIQRDLPNKWTENGEILVLENELLGYAPGSARNDTLLHGRMKNGKRKGIWTVKFVDQYARNDWETHQFDFSRKQKVKLTDNGAWELKYVNKATAIEGDFENGLKVGEWRFYNEDGSLRTQRFYENDTLKRSIVHVFIDGMPCESRTYYFSADACVQSFVNGTKAFFAYVDMSSEPDPIIIDAHHFNILNDTKTGYRKIKKGTVEYESAVREHFVNYLYPELRQSVLPFSF